jgi:hypothetical protein
MAARDTHAAAPPTERCGLADAAGLPLVHGGTQHKPALRGTAIIESGTYPSWAMIERQIDK